MARVMELHAPVKIVQRSSGRTATAAAAYRAASRIECERTGQVHDYRRKRGVEETALLAPDDAPEWAHDRRALWNAAEAREKHPRAQTAREIEIAFPSEFSASQRKQAGLQIGQWIVARYGAAADLAWHEPSRKGDERNHHLHVMFTTRRFENGEWAKNKDRALDDLKRGPEEIKTMRAAMAGVLNDISAREKLGVYVEHVSFEARGLDREATKHLGPNVSEMENRGLQTDRGQENRDIEARNAAREKQYQDKKIVDIQVARQRQEAKLAAQKILDQNVVASRKEDQSPAPDHDLAREHVSPVMGFHPAAWAPFYDDTMKRRRKMLEDQDREHAAREAELKKQMVGLHRQMDGRNVFVRFWRNVTGKQKADQLELSKATAAFDEIQEKKRLAQEVFETDRRRRMEELKEEHRQKEQSIEEQPEQKHAGKESAQEKTVVAGEFEEATHARMETGEHAAMPASEPPANDDKDAARQAKIDEMKARLERKRGLHM